MQNSKFTKYIAGAALSCSFFLCTPVMAQVEFPAPSPRAEVVQKVGLGEIAIDYSRPSLKGREVFGSLVPYGQLWRTGANAPTTIGFSESVRFGGEPIPAGTYLLLTVPGRDSWQVILNRQTDLSSVNDYDEAQDQVRVQVQPVPLETPQETFTIAVDHLRDDSAQLVLAWDRTRVSVTLELDTEARLQTQIEEAMAGDGEVSPGVYANAATFYYQTDRDLGLALDWIEKALQARPDAFFWEHRRALILAKMGRTEEARAAAERSMELAEPIPAFRQEYEWRNRQLIESL